MAYGDGFYGDPLPIQATDGGILVSATTTPGNLITKAGQVQYGPMLLGVGTSAGWFELVGWRDTPDTSVSDTTRPQGHGAYPGDIWGEAQTVTFTYRIKGNPHTTHQQRLDALRVIEANFPLDGIERALVVNDGAGPTQRMARVLQRRVPQPWDLEFLKVLECSVQWLCADPRRYSLAATTATVALGSSIGGLVYPLAYPLSYGTSAGGSRTVTNNGNTPAPIRATFTGPLVNPVLTSSQGWRLGFRVTLAAGETLSVDTGAGTVLLNGDVDRLYVVDATSSPLERCQLASGLSTLSLSASAGSGQVAVTYRHAYL